jgi:hypothetical protein
LNVRTERPDIRGEIERGLVCFQQLLIKERSTNYEEKYRTGYLKKIIKLYQQKFHRRGIF